MNFVEMDFASGGGEIPIEQLLVVRNTEVINTLGIYASYSNNKIIILRNCTLAISIRYTNNAKLTKNGNAINWGLANAVNSSSSYGYADYNVIECNSGDVIDIVPLNSATMTVLHATIY